MLAQSDEWLSTREAAEVLSIGRTSLWKLARQGKLQVFQRGPDRRAHYYRRADVQRLASQFHLIEQVAGQPQG